MQAALLKPQIASKAGKFFKIGQVAKQIGVSPSCLRNWEKLGLFTASRTEGGYRLYSHETVNHLKQIQYLRKSTRVNIPGIRFHQAQGAEEIPQLAPANYSSELPVRLASLRRAQNWTLEDLSHKTGVSTRFLAAVEEGKVMPFSILPKLAAAYQTNVVSFFDVDGEQRKLVRRRDRRILKSGPAIQMELLAVGATLMEPHLIRIAPHTSSGGSYRHDGEELLYLLQGKLEIWLDEIERYVLGPGDTLYFKSSQAHRWCTLTDKECLVLWINSPPSF